MIHLSLSYPVALLSILAGPIQNCLLWYAATSRFGALFRHAVSITSSAFNTSPLRLIPCHFLKRTPQSLHQTLLFAKKKSSPIGKRINEPMNIQGLAESRSTLYDLQLGHIHVQPFLHHISLQGVISRRQMPAKLWQAHKPLYIKSPQSSARHLL